MNNTKKLIIIVFSVFFIIAVSISVTIYMSLNSNKYLNKRTFDTQSIQNEAISLAKDYFNTEVSNPQVIHQRDRIFVMFNLDGTGIPMNVPSEIQTVKNENYGFIELNGKIGSYKIVNIARSNYDSSINRKSISISGANDVHYGVIIDDRIAKIEFYCGNFLEETFVRKDKEHFYLACLENSQGSNIYHAKLYDKDGKLLYTQNII